MPKLKRQRLDEQGQGKVTASEDESPTAHKLENHAESQQPRGRAFSSRSLFVRSLPPTVSSESLAEFFSRSYPLKHATVVFDKVTKQSKCFGFVTLADIEDAENAQKDFHGTEFHGRKINVEIAEPRHRQQVREASVSETFIVKPKSRHSVWPTAKLIVRNLPWSIKDEDQLSKLFMSYGKVRHVIMPRKGPGLSAGFAFVVLRGRKNAERALQGLNGKEVGGRTLAIDWAVDKQVWQSTQQVEDQNIKSRHPDENMEPKIEELSSVGGNPEADTMSETKTGAQEDSELDKKSIENAEEPKTKTTGAASDTSTLFVRNIPFDVDDKMLHAHFTAFGPIRYARVVVDQATERSKGTGFVSFYNREDADLCLRDASRLSPHATLQTLAGKDDTRLHHKRSVLEDADVDRNRKLTLEGRVLQVSMAVNRQEAAKITFANSDLRDARDRDRRRLYLLAEGTISSNNPLYWNLSPLEIKMREDSAKQRQMLIRSNPSLHLSLTRLSIRNLPRSMTSKALKSIAREAVVGFAGDVKFGSRKQLSKEELARSGDEMKQAERQRKAKGKGVVKQAKIIFEGRGGGKVTEDSGAGRSRGYGFVEYSSHRWALMGLRWLNGRALNPPTDVSGSAPSPLPNPERKKRLIVEFAIENAQVILRRRQKEDKARARSKIAMEQKGKVESQIGYQAREKDHLRARTIKGSKGRRVMALDSQSQEAEADRDGAESVPDDTTKASIRQAIIRRKRMGRKMRKKAV